AASEATAVRLCEPLVVVVVFQENVYGALVRVPTLTPSTFRLTEVTPTLSLAFTCTETVPETVAPPAGEAKLTVGGVVSGTGLLTVTVMELLELLPAASLAEAISVWVPLARVVVLEDQV